MTTRRSSGPNPPLPPRITQDLQRVLAILVGVRQVVDQQIARLAEAEETLTPLVDGPPTLIEPLTPRQLDVLRLIAEGYSEPQIAQRLGLRLRTVTRHMRQVREKLGAQNRVEAVLTAWKLGLI